MLAMGIAHRKGERSQALKGRNTKPFGIMEFMVRSAGNYFPHEKLLQFYTRETFPKKSRKKAGTRSKARRMIWKYEDSEVYLKGVYPYF
jgi:hypothetical protein